ncbi:hypothetical protein HMPREF1979_02283 [Actinomyces johnsonii F0542]|uniref:Uncharacterized protein n=1 Tax=Actinomyces johnsonii F0542 TaxID=1321818 RepID=U1QKM0_9ACTO|nr:hypothetical protein HMPREF1979_02283 [Actinomyces johnsonii F0542]
MLGLFLCVRLTLIPAEAQPVPGAARRALRRLAAHRLKSHRRLHAPDRRRPRRPGTGRGGLGPHGPALGSSRTHLSPRGRTLRLQSARLAVRSRALERSGVRQAFATGPSAGLGNHSLWDGQRR